MKTLAVASNPFDRYKGVDKPDEKKEPKAVPDGLESLVEIYRDYMHSYLTDSYFASEMMREPSARFEELGDVLTPEEIDKFLQLTALHEDDERHQEATCYFLSRLIQNSYEAGHNGFTLNSRTLTKRLGCGIAFLKGKMRNPIKITINGDVEAIGREVRYVDFDIRGNCVELGPYPYSTFAYDADYSTFHIHGNIAGFIGARKSTFYLHGKFGSFFRETKTYEGGYHEAEGPRQSTFIVYSRKKFNRLLKKLPRGYKNRAILMDKQGNIIDKEKV